MLVFKVQKEMDCKRGLVPDKDENVRGYSLVQCEMKGCHTLYPKGKNGNTCEYCESEVCEICGDNGVWIDDYDCFYCSKGCFKEGTL